MMDLDEILPRHQSSRSKHLEDTPKQPQLSQSLVLSQTRALPIDRSFHLEHALSSSTILPAKSGINHEKEDALLSNSLSSNANSELESHWISLGHTGFLKADRDRLKNHLIDEKISSSKYRSLSFRLAARVAAREAKIIKNEKMIAQKILAGYLSERKNNDMLDKLRTTIRTYEKQGTGLLRLLSGIGIDGEHGTINSLMPSPPFSPRALSPENTPEDSQYLPTEILDICQYRVDALLRECRLSRDTLILLKETEKSLQKEANEHQRNIEDLQKQKLDSDAEIQRLNKQLSTVGLDLQSNKQRISSLESERQSLKDIIIQRDKEKKKLIEDKQQLFVKFTKLQSTLGSVQKQLKDAQAKADLLQKSKSAIEDVVRTHEERGREAESTIRQSQSELAAAREQLSRLESDCSDQASIINGLKQNLADQQQDIDRQIKQAKESEKISSKRMEELIQEVENARKASVDAEEKLISEHFRTVELEQSQQELQATVKTQKSLHSELEKTNTEALADLQKIKDIHATFVESSEKLSKELEGEKAKTVALIETESKLKSQIAEYSEVVSRLQSRVKALEEEMLIAKSETDESTESSRLVQQQLDDTRQTLEDVKKAHAEHMLDMVKNHEELQEALQSAREEISRLKDAVEKSQNESASLVGQMEQIRTELDQSHQNARMQAEKHAQDMEQRQEIFDTRINTIQQELESFQNKISSKTVELKTLLSRNDINEEELVNLRKDLKASKKSQQVKQNELETAMAEKAVSNSEVERLRKDLVKSLEIAKDKEEMLQKAHDNHSANLSKISSLQSALDSTKHSIDTKSKEMDLLSSSKTAAEKQISRLQQELGQFRQDLEAKDQQIDQVIEEKASLAGELESLKQSSSKVQRELEGLRIQYEDAVHDVHATEDKLRQLEAAVGDAEHSAVQAQTLVQMAQADNLSLSRELQELQIQYEQSSTELEAKEQELNGLQMNKSSDIETIQRSQKELELSQSRAQDLEDEHERLVQQHQHTTAELVQSRDNHREVIALVEQLRSNLAQINEEKANAASQVALLTEEVKMSREAAREKENEHSQVLDNQRASFATQLDSVKGKLEQKSNEAQDQKAQYELRLAEHQTTISKHETDLKSSKEQIAELTREHEDFSHKNDYLQEQLREITDEKVIVDGQLYIMKTQLALKEALKKDQDLTLRTTRAKLITIKNSRRQISGQFRAAEADARRMSRKINILDHEIAELRLEIIQAAKREKSLETEIEEVRQQSLTFQAMCRKKDNELTQLKDMHAHQLREFKDQVRQLETERANLTHSKDQELANVRNEHGVLIQELNNKLNHWQNQYEQQVNRTKSKENLIESIREGNREERIEIERLKSSINTWSDKYDQKQVMLEANNTRISDLQQTIKVKDQDIDHLKSNLETSNQEMNALKTDLEHHKQKHSRVSMILTEERAQTSELRAQLEEQTHQANELNSELRTLRRSNGSQVKRISLLETDIHELQEQNTTLSNQSSEMKAQNADLNRRINKAEADVCNKDEALTHFHRQFRTLQKQATDASRKVEVLEQNLTKRDDKILQLHHEAEEHFQRIRDLEAQLQGQQVQRSPLKRHRRYTGSTIPSSPPQTPISMNRTPSMLLLASNKQGSPHSQESPLRQRSYRSYRPSSPTDSVGYPSLLRSTPSIPSSPAHEYNIMTPYTETILESPDGTSSPAPSESIFTRAPIRSHTSHSMRSFRPKTPLSMSFRHSSHLAAVPSSSEEVDPPVRPMSAVPKPPLASHATDGAVLLDHDGKRKWGEKHPKLYKLVHMGKRFEHRRTASHHL